MPLIIPKFKGPPEMPPLAAHHYAGTNKKLGAKNQKYLKNPAAFNRYGATTSLNAR